ncbi:MAG: hypothetical protein ABIT09_05965 [Croceibacterium sp.]
MNRFALLLVPCGALLLAGCLAQTALDIITLPVKVATTAVDLATTSQAEADQKRGRAVRQREQHLGNLQRDYERLTKKCASGDTNACEKSHAVYSEIQLLLPTIPVETKPR